MSQASHKEVIQLLLKGKTITEVANLLDVSRTTVYNRKKDFLDYAEKEGLFMAAEHYEVEETLEKITNLARLLESNDLDVNDAVEGCEIITLLKSFNVKNPEGFISDVMNASLEAGITGYEITDYSLELKKLHEELGKSYSQLIEEVDEKKNTFGELEERVREINEKIKSDSERLEKQIKESETTRDKLNDFNNIVRDLNSLDINIEDLPRLESLVKNMKQLDYNLEEILGFYDSTIILREGIERKEEKNNRLEEKNNVLKRENDQIEIQLKSNMELLSALKSFEKNEIEPNDILQIIKTVTSMSQILNISERDALDRFIEDVQTQYNERNKYKFQVTEMENLHSLYREKSTLLKEEIEVYEEVLRDRKTSIDALKKMEALGIDDQNIVEWSKLVGDIGYDVSEFRSILEEVGSLPDYRDIKTREIKKLEEKEKKLQENIQELKVELSSLKDTLSVIRESFEDEIKKVAKTVEDFDNYFNSTETGFRVHSKELIDEVVYDFQQLLLATRNEWNNDMATLDGTISKILEESQRILANAYKGGRIVGQFHSVEPIHKILREEEVPRLEATISIITMLTYIQNWLNKNTEEVDPVFQEVIKNLMEDLGDIY